MAAPSIITLTTDFGQGSPYVAQMKAAVLAIHPQATLVDVTHAIPPQDVRQAAIVLHDTTPVFPAATIHVAVIDPGVGTQRAIVYAEIGAQRYVAPDNGLLSLLAQTQKPSRVFSVTEDKFWRRPVSATFHGRDIMAPVAAHLSRGAAPEDIGKPQRQLVDLNWPRPVVAANSIAGEVLLVDSFGNLVTNITADLIPADCDVAALRVRCAGRRIEGLANAYAQRAETKIVALVGSSGRLEIAVVNGNAAKLLAATVGERVEVDW